MALAMHGCVRIGLNDALQRPTPLEKKPTSKMTPPTGTLKNLAAGCSLSLLADSDI
jgi:hypothetical protein